MQTICRYIADPTKKKVVLMAHSQGGIIMSTWVVSDCSELILPFFQTDY